MTAAMSPDDSRPQAVAPPVGPVDPLYDDLCRSGEEYAQADRLPEAFLYFAQALDADASKSRAWGGMGVACFRQGCHNASRAFFEMAVRLDPADEDSVLNWAEVSPSSLSDQDVRRALAEMGVAEGLLSRALASRAP